MSTPPSFDAPVWMGSHRSIAMPFGMEKRTRMVWLPDDEKILICLFVLTEFTNVTDRQTDGQTHRHHMTT